VATKSLCCIVRLLSRCDAQLYRRGFVLALPEGLRPRGEPRLHLPPAAPDLPLEALMLRTRPLLARWARPAGSAA
jgi:hypothetical protein